MSAAVVVPLITAGIQGLFSLFGGHQSNNAARDAAAITARSNAAALEYEREQADRAAAYQREQDAYQRQLDAYNHNRDSISDATAAQARADRGPARAASQGAVTTLSALLTPGQTLNGATGVVHFANGSNRTLSDLVAERSRVEPIPGTTPPGSSLAPPTPPTAPDTGAVRMRAQDGTEMDVPADRVAEALRKGAVRVSGSQGNATTPVGSVDTFKTLTGY